MGFETRYVLGDYKAICDICGFQYLASQLMENWKGERVCDKDWEPRHPQEFVRPVPEDQKPSWTRVDTQDDVAQTIGSLAPTATAIVYGTTLFLMQGGNNFTLPDTQSALFKNLTPRIQVSNTTASPGASLGLLLSGADSFAFHAQTAPKSGIVLAGETSIWRCFPDSKTWLREQ